jgi:hypothetical protein
MRRHVLHWHHGDQVLFQPTIATLSVPLSEFADPERAIALIRTKLAEVRR